MTKHASQHDAKFTLEQLEEAAERIRKCLSEAGYRVIGELIDGRIEVQQINEDTLVIAWVQALGGREPLLEEFWRAWEVAQAGIAPICLKHWIEGVSCFECDAVVRLMKDCGA